MKTVSAGIALQRFYEKSGHLPWNMGSKIRWPVLFSAVSSGILSFADYAFAETLLRSHLHVDERGAAFLCHLLKASRSGHLCVCLDKHHLSPAPQELWFEDSPSDALIQLLSQMHEGIVLLPTTVLSDLTDGGHPETPVCRFRNAFYLHKYWMHETLFINHLTRLLEAHPSLMPNRDHANGSVDQLKREGKLVTKQAQAILSAVENCLTIICGGPGSGKTYTAAQFIKIFLDALPSDQRCKCEIAVAAPTGKAASNLYNSLLKALQGMSEIEMMKPQTLHSLLGIYKKGSSNTLAADLIVVDEASMIDAKIMARLISSTKSGARLVLLGDKHQLPSIEAGSLFADLITLFRMRPGLDKHLIEFTDCLRSELKSIVSFADAINEGNASNVIGLLNASDQGVHRVVFKDERRVRESLVDYAIRLFPKPNIDTSDPRAILEAFNRFRLLSPLRKGPFGVEAMNNLFLERFSANGNGWQAFPIAICSNDYKLNLFNGEVGLLIHRSGSGRSFQLNEDDYAMFPEGGSAGAFRKIPAMLLPQFEFAYCLSVHKSQGSEFDHVLLLLPEGAESFGREMFYTAVTRAKKKIELWGNDERIGSTLLKTTNRFSGVVDRIINR